MVSTLALSVSGVSVFDTVIGSWARIGPWSIWSSRSMMEMAVSVSPATMADWMGDGPR